MKVKLPYVIHFRNREDEVFNDYNACKERMDFLYHTEGIQINLQINSSEGHDYYEHVPDFYAKTQMLRQSGKKFVTLNRPNPTEWFMTSNLRRRLKKTSVSI